MVPDIRPTKGRLLLQRIPSSNAVNWKSCNCCERQEQSSLRSIRRLILENVNSNLRSLRNIFIWEIILFTKKKKKRLKLISHIRLNLKIYKFLKYKMKTQSTIFSFVQAIQFV